MDRVRIFFNLPPMISYNPKEWFSYIFRFHKADTFRTLAPVMCGIAVYAAVVAFFEIEYWKLSDTTHIKNVSTMHNLLGVVLSMLLVFRTNTAYERWWEGRKLWGELVNNSRNFALKISAMLPAGKDRDFFQKAIPLYAEALKIHLHRDPVEPEPLRKIGVIVEQGNHVPNIVAKAIVGKINALYKSRKISGEQLIIFDNELESFGNICGACERIKNTPIPYSYSAFIKKFIFFYTMTMPFGHAFTLGYYMVPIVIFVFYALASLELIAEEIEDPFGKDPNDLPLMRISSTIQHNVDEIFMSR